MKDLTSGRIGKSILGFATPMLIGNIFQQTYNIVDSIIVGQYLGKEALAAVGASFPIIFALISFVIGIAMGGNIVVSQYFGARDYDKVRRAIDTIYIFVFISSLVITTIGIIFSQGIFRLMRLPEELIPQATLYFNTFMLGIVFLFGFNATQAILRGLGDSLTPLVFLIISSVLNVVLDILFIRYFGMGIAGAAVATVISHGGAFIASIFYLNRTHKLVKLHIKEMVFDWDIFRKSVRIGLPSGFQQTFVSFGMIALFRIARSDAMAEKDSRIAGALIAITIPVTIAPGGLYLLPKPWNLAFVAVQTLIWLTILAFLLRTASRSARLPAM